MCSIIIIIIAKYTTNHFTWTYFRNVKPSKVSLNCAKPISLIKTPKSRPKTLLHTLQCFPYVSSQKSSRIYLRGMVQKDNVHLVIGIVAAIQDSKVPATLTTWCRKSLWLCFLESYPFRVLQKMGFGKEFIRWI